MMRIIKAFPVNATGPRNASRNVMPEKEPRNGKGPMPLGYITPAALLEEVLR